MDKNDKIIEFKKLKMFDNFMICFNKELELYTLVLYNTTYKGNCVVFDFSEFKRIMETMAQIVKDGEKVANDKISI